MNQNQKFKARMTLLMARPGHGKTTILLKDLLPREIQARKRQVKRGLPLARLPSLQYPRIDIFDPKGEIAPTLIDYTPARVFEHETAAKAARSAVEAMQTKGELGICVIEELMTVPQKDYAEITRLAAIRRLDTSGVGIAFYATTQRPYIMPVAVRSIADFWLVGSITDSDDLKAIEKIAGSEFSSTLPTLPIGDFALYDFGKGEDF